MALSVLQAWLDQLPTQGGAMLSMESMLTQLSAVVIRVSSNSSSSSLRRSRIISRCHATGFHVARGSYAEISSLRRRPGSAHTAGSVLLPPGRLACCCHLTCICPPCCRRMTWLCLACRYLGCPTQVQEMGMGSGHSMATVAITAALSLVAIGASTPSEGFEGACVCACARGALPPPPKQRARALPCRGPCALRLGKREGPPELGWCRLPALALAARRRRHTHGHARARTRSRLHAAGCLGGARAARSLQPPLSLAPGILLPLRRGRPAGRAAGP